MKFFYKLCEAGRVFDLGIAKLETVVIILCASALIIAEITASILHLSINANFAWIEELLKYIVIWIGLIGASLSTRTGEHISIEIVSRFASQTMRRWLLACTSLISFIICVYLTIAAVGFIEEKRISYWSGGGAMSTTKSIQLSITQYQCPDMIVQQRQQTQYLEKQIQSNLAKLTDAIQTHNHTELPQLASQVQEHIQELQQSDWTKDWLTDQWKNKWQSLWLEVWQNQGLPQWEQYGEKAISERERIEWQNKWRLTFWNTEGKQKFEQAWAEEGQAIWDEQADFSDYSEQEFKSQWRNQWASKIWQQDWQSKLNEAWKSGGNQECFLQNCQRRFVQQQWKVAWKNDWKKALQEHTKITWSSGPCEICGKEKIAIPLSIPHWLLLIIIPISLTIMCWRFLLLFMEATFLGQIAPRALDEDITLNTCQEPTEQNSQNLPTKTDNTKV